MVKRRSHFCGRPTKAGGKCRARVYPPKGSACWRHYKRPPHVHDFRLHRSELPATLGEGLCFCGATDGTPHHNPALSRIIFDALKRPFLFVRDRW
jgi:hypothetical protein